MPHFLLSNDDGIDAPGLWAAYEALAGLGQVTVVAPATESSSVSHGITLGKPLLIKRVEGKDKSARVYAVTGTPADCVKWALFSGVLKDAFDGVVAGINAGANDGGSVVYSGTCAAAREGALFGLPALAVSLEEPRGKRTVVETKRRKKTPGARAHELKDEFRWTEGFQRGGRVLSLWAELAMRVKWPPRVFLNINVPASAHCRGIWITRQGEESIRAVFSPPQRTPEGMRSWMSGQAPPHGRDLTQDTWALKEGWVTVTPVQCDGTAQEWLSPLKHEWRDFYEKKEKTLKIEL